MRFGRAAAPKRVKSGRRGEPRGWRHRILAVGAAALALPIAAGVAAPTAATAAPVHAPVLRAPAGGYEELMVPSVMGPIKVQVQWASRGGDAALYLLDGLRARDDRNAWSFETNAMEQFKNDNITLVMPVGGQSSFYTDWYAPSNTNGQKTTYKWETFLTQELPNFLAGYGVSKTNNAVAGLSMGGSAALALAAYHRDQFKYAASYSGYLNISAPGMREAIRIAMLDAGRFNVDSMAAPWSPQWLRMDPFVFAPQLRGLPMYISAASGLPGQHDRPNSPVGVFNTGNAMALEALSLVNTRAFQVRLKSLGIPAQFDFPATGTHSWKYWEGQLWNSRQGILDALGAW
ncbi:esterase family protein [Nocardia farcinica]|uniref:Putative mycolyltransferase n=1 Tax=Nocardia farcinica (strain IFM 10152) TaxID=247156 RepID=Q5Z3G6_NOCFA|nr:MULTISPECIES: alpha/beta hydrolase family protein [Nocardia]AXK87006.1 esterase family protein [Nocardia farcinica]MBA4858427.1 esterase family protein [Nocardia farcinica]MBC9815675.1 esterase family protein [Nocardia farcinica]MBF6069906.1 esterase family protein [Nocardia farcinica]MBF6141637.1 esterase family protein [Nocardia farcinica]